MANYEQQVYEAVMAGQDVYYSVTPAYAGSRTVPIGFKIQAQGVNPDGTPGLVINAYVPNVLNGRNLGTFSDPSTGAAVPTGSMP